jgi:dGTP triphosphohydrolase
MFERCIKCERIGRDCVPNLIALPWPELLDWWKLRQAHLGWTNQVLSEKSSVPHGTINRIKAGEDDARYSTMRSIIHALIGSYSVEFPCQKKLDQEFAHIETLEKQCCELASANEGIAAQMKALEEAHRNEILALKADYKEQVNFLKDNNVFLRKQFEWLQERDRKEQTNREKG